MQLNDLSFFYHSGAGARRVVGVVTVVKEWYSDDDNEVIVDVMAVGEMRTPRDLKEMKSNEKLSGFVLFCLGSLDCRLWRFQRRFGGGFVRSEVVMKVMEKVTVAAAVTAEMIRSMFLVNLLRASSWLYELFNLSVCFTVLFN
ncbi:uncharacterized protein LOC130015631 [Mercurialis annua]|uniref:uncharacterized protein LOC130015631 n=1 Tax=Mercurialis annua TaxID=3986 RepID=UPI0024AD4B49|nr:uncharacterized protein LOC130015631 [Mercurialis annua]